jgi:hypothetical protein
MTETSSSGLLSRLDRTKITHGDEVATIDAPLGQQAPDQGPTYVVVARPRRIKTARAG